MGRFPGVRKIHHLQRENTLMQALCVCVLRMHPVFLDYVSSWLPR